MSHKIGGRHIKTERVIGKKFLTLFGDLASESSKEESAVIVTQKQNARRGQVSGPKKGRDRKPPLPQGKKSSRWGKRVRNKVTDTSWKMTSDERLRALDLENIAQHDSLLVVESQPMMPIQHITLSSLGDSSQSLPKSVYRPCTVSSTPQICGGKKIRPPNLNVSDIAPCEENICVPVEENHELMSKGEDYFNSPVVESTKPRVLRLKNESSSAYCSFVRGSAVVKEQRYSRAVRVRASTFLFGDDTTNGAKQASAVEDGITASNATHHSHGSDVSHHSLPDQSGCSHCESRASIGYKLRSKCRKRHDKSSINITDPTKFSGSRDLFLENSGVINNNSVSACTGDEKEESAVVPVSSIETSLALIRVHANDVLAMPQVDNPLSPRHDNQFPKTPINCSKSLAVDVSALQRTVLKCVSNNGSFCPSDEVLRFCSPNEIIPWTDGFARHSLPEATKIGEGVFGEVFKMCDLDGISSVFKIVPVDGDRMVNDQQQMNFEQILPEIAITVDISNLRNDESNQCSNFVECKRIFCVQGSYPQMLLEAWDSFHEKRGSENDRPDFFDSNQLFIVFEFEDGGVNLESYAFHATEEANSIFEQVTCALAVAEQALHFEHRDLHIGNILVRKTAATCLGYVIDDDIALVTTHGVQAFIIDFTLSRMGRDDDYYVFSNLAADEELFQGQGDYQFDVYRQMREETQDDWQKFHPKTNIFWLVYLLDKILSKFRYGKSGRKARKCDFPHLRKLQEDIQEYESAYELVAQYEYFDDLWCYDD